MKITQLSVLKRIIVEKSPGWVARKGAKGAHEERQDELSLLLPCALTRTLVIHQTHTHTHTHFTTPFDTSPLRARVSRCRLSAGQRSVEVRLGYTAPPTPVAAAAKAAVDARRRRRGWADWAHLLSGLSRPILSIQLDHGWP